MPHSSLPLPDRTFAAVLFDMDGTLIDSIGAVERSWRTWAGEYGVDLARLQGLHGVAAMGVTAMLLPALSAEDQAGAVLRIEELEVADTDGIIVLPGAAEALEALAAGGAKVAIVTSCTDPLAEARIAATGLRHPEVVVTASHVTAGKPDPEPFVLGASLLGVDPADCLVVEDAVAGLTAGRAAGAATLAVRHTTPDEVLEPLADLIVDGLDAVRFTVGADGRVSLGLARG